MNYYKARQRQTDLTWAYTCENGSHIHAVGYCAGQRALSVGKVFEETPAEVERERPHAEKYHEGGHATELEACECYRQYLLDNRLKFYPHNPNAITWHKCAMDGCEIRTSGHAIMDSVRMWPVCDAHQNRESIEILYPSDIRSATSSY